MVGKGAPEGNQYATKEGEGVTISLYLSQVDIAYLQRFLRDHGENPDKWRKAAKKYAKEGIFRRIKEYVDAEII